MKERSASKATQKRSFTRKVIATVTLFFYVAGFVAAGHAILGTRTAPGAIAWSVSLVAMPFVAVPAYLVFGRNKFEGLVQAYEEQQDEIDGLVADIKARLAPWAVVPSGEPSVYRTLTALSGFEALRGNAVDLLVDGTETFEDIIAGLEEAQDYILFQFYMVHDDAIGRRIRDVLIRRAQAGVRVYFLYDEIGSQGLTADYLAGLRDAGVEVSSFRPTQGSGNRFQLNFRNHRKMVAVDGTTAWVGGHNVGDEYLGRDPDFSPWRDTHVRITGPAALQVQAVILGDWYWATRELPDLQWAAQPAEGSDLPVMIIPSAPSQRFETAGLVFTQALNSAAKRIWISAPYFVPDEAVMKALELAALRGVDVRIITTGKPDSLPVYLAAFHYMEQLHGLGIRFYSYTPGFMHQKVMLIDNAISMVGTANFDNRSFRLNFEVMSLIAGDAFAGEMETMLERDFAHAVPIDPGTFEDKPLYWRLGVALSRLAAPVL